MFTSRTECDKCLNTKQASTLRGTNLLGLDLSKFGFFEICLENRINKQLKITYHNSLFLV